ncbi:MAG: hypothetical protein ACYCSN_14690 [Acidobacteriaceae bacterium]
MNNILRSRTAGGFLTLAMGAVGVWVTPRIEWIVWAIVALVLINVLLNLHDEAKQFQAVIRSTMTALIPVALQFLGGLDGSAHVFVQVGIVLAFSVMLQHVFPQIVQFLRLPVAEQKGLESLVKDLEAKVTAMAAAQGSPTSTTTTTTTTNGNTPAGG